MSAFPTALVIDDDQSMLRFLAEALSTFRPGFRVITATDLPKAARWLGAVHPDLIVIRLNGYDIAELTEWTRANGISHSHILGISLEPNSSVDVGAIVTEPVSLSLLLKAVRLLTQNASGYDRSTELIHNVRSRHVSL